MELRPRYFFSSAATIASKLSLISFLKLVNLVEGTTRLGEETLAHCEQALEFIITCLIVNEPPQFVHILGMVFDLVNCFFKLRNEDENWNSTLCVLKRQGQFVRGTRLVCNAGKRACLF